MVFGGNSDPALARAAAHGDGWYGFNLSGIGDVRRCVAAIREHCARLDRDFDRLDLSVSVVDFGTDELDELADVGVNELVLVDAPPPRAGDVGERVVSLRSDGSLVPRPSQARCTAVKPEASTGRHRPGSNEMARPGLEPGTPRFSVVCSTN